MKNNLDQDFFKLDKITLPVDKIVETVRIAHRGHILHVKLNPAIQILKY